MPAAGAALMEEEPHGLWGSLVVSAAVAANKTAAWHLQRHPQLFNTAAG